jgi:DNA-binding CsgD family transcriptional regulator
LVRSEFELARSLGSLAARAFPNGHPLKARGLLISGRAAYFQYEFEEAFELHTQASTYAVTVDDINDAAWGRCLAAFALEDSRMHAAVTELESLPNLRATDRVRLETARHQLAMFGWAGGLSVGALAESGLLSQVSNPWVRSGWSYTFGTALMVSARYDEAQAVLQAALAELDEVSFSFAVPHGEWSLAGVELGLRRFAWCDRRLRRIERNPSYTTDLHTQINVRALRARMLLAEQRAAEAVKLTSDDFPDCPTPAMYGEYLATRAVALAVVGNKTRAADCAIQAQKVTKSIYTHVLCASAQTIIALDDSIAAADAAERLLDTASELGVWDPVVCCMRASPPLAKQLSLVPRHCAELRRILLQARDDKIAKSVGLVTRQTGSRGFLTRREHEVMDQVKLGRRNAQIAASLFISTGTVKSHLDHIYGKLGVRSRTEAAARYAEIENAESDWSSASGSI